MDEKIAEIERLTGKPVYVGSLAGTADLTTRWACVTDSLGYLLQVPARTDAEAVDGLLQAIREGEEC